MLFLKFQLKIKKKSFFKFDFTVKRSVQFSVRFINKLILFEIAYIM